MFISTQNKNSLEYYEKMLKAAGSLSNLFSESPQPYLGYRLVENIFCKSFSAENVSRSDCSIDASKNNIGIGIKTFLYKNGLSFEKVAEFNRELNLFKELDPEKMILKIAELRNQRIDFTKRNYRITNMLYHCVVRDIGKILIYETSMDQIELNKINGVSLKGNVINFKDSLNEYKFSIAKSTLYRQFTMDKHLMEFLVKIIADPFDILEKILENSTKDLIFTPIKEQEHIFLPLYSDRQDGKFVAEKSGLNQWNAEGRTRNYNEIYIPIPIWIHRKYPTFFPPRETSFSLLLPNRESLNSKVCQDNSKALMSNPNCALGKWLLRDILGLKEGELLTYEKLENIGLDSVVIYKKNENTYDIDFAKIGSYERFKGEDSLETSEEVS